MIDALERIRSGGVEALGLLLEESWEPLAVRLATLPGSTESAKDAVNPDDGVSPTEGLRWVFR